eukprot:g26397.t1
MVRATWPVRRVVDRWNTQTDDAEDLIYASKTLALEPLVTAAYWAKVLKRPEPGEVDHQVVFDCFPPDHPGGLPTLR